MSEIVDKSGNKTSIKNKILENKYIKKTLNFFNVIFNSPKYSFLFLMAVLLIVTAVLVLYPLAYNTFLNCNTDDVIQYHAYIVGFFNKLKTNTLSIYDTSLWGGTSFFAGVYYLPLDLFLVLAYVLSYIMPTEVAYVLTNILRIVGGSLIFYVFLIRKGFKIRVGILAGLIYFVGGVTEAEFVFPVYIGVCFYAPAAMLIVDLVVEKKKLYYLLIPLYTFVVIIYDYYIAFMLMALLCIYFVINYHMTSKKFFLMTKRFYIDLLKLFLYIFLGLMIASFILVPSLAYVINESSRINSTFDHSFIYYTTYKDGNYVLAIRHYFTGWMNMFLPNNPFNLCLLEAGDYVREHYSLYVTTGGLIYLIFFFFVRGKANHRLKFWVLIFNIMFLMPVFAMLFTVSKWAYSRWFFIVYMINLYAMAIGMNDLDLKVGKKNFIKFFPFVILTLGLVSTLYTYIYNPDIFIHYSKGDNYFSPLLIGASIFIGVYLLILVFYFIVQLLGKEKLLKLCPTFILVTIIGEVIFAAIIDFSTVGSTDFMDKREHMEEQYYHLYDVGYNPKDGYRINLYTTQGRNTPNANIMFGMTNQNQFFQSFYNTPLNTYNSAMHLDYSDSWSKGSILGYSLINGPIFNMKYVVADDDFSGVYLPEKYYKLLDDNKGIKYYSLENALNFIVYDEIYTDSPNDKAFYNDLSLLFAGYIPDPNKAEDKMSDEEKVIAANLKKATSAKMSVIAYKDIKNRIKDNYDIKVKTFGTVINDEYNGYFRYDISGESFDEIFNKDSFYILPNTNEITKMEYCHMYIKHATKYEVDKEDGTVGYEEKDVYYYPTHYNVGYKGYNYNDSERQELWVQYKNQTDPKTMTIYGYDYDIYDDFIARQNEYKNRVFTLNDDTINIKFTNTTNETKIVKTGFTYSDDWKCSGYETINVDGGFLGVVVKGNVKDVDITLTFEPKYFDESIKLSAIGTLVYLNLSLALVTIEILRKRRYL